MTTDTTPHVTLADGRVITYSDRGDPGAPVVVFVPGFMACRLTGRPSPVARVITVDRPGIGGSSAIAKRRVVDHADDVAALADQLGLERFAVLGHSGGSPYAAACAARLGLRVSALGIACGFAPMHREGATEGMHPRMAKAAPALRRAPWMARLVAGSLPRQYRRDAAKAFEKQFGRDLPECDRRAIENDAAARETLLAAAVEACAQGPRGLAIELQNMFARPWGIDLGSITAPAQLWYGADDALTPPQMGRYLQTQLPAARLTVYPGEGHMALFTHWDEIVAALV